MSHPHEVMTGLRQRIAKAGIRLTEHVITGSEDRGTDVGHVPLYTLTLTRDDGRTLTENMATGQNPWEPEAFEVMDTLLVCASLVLDEGIGDTPTARAQIDRLIRFVEGTEACWECWLHATDRDPGRQDDYDQPDPEAP